ncbi:MAG TPA: acyltransferase domain-containing protein, partial [Solirubrobacteraceae bacterium]|nr:acyltransferase domain-containing protein [Solirubrobacteraceae bacterium]
MIAAVNGPTSVILSGELPPLEQLQKQYEDEGVRARIIPVDYAAHSPQVETIREALLDGCAGIRPRTGEVPFYSAVTGGLLDTGGLDAEYWYRNLRETVRFEVATRAALGDRRRRFVEVSPHPVLTVGLGETAEQELVAEPTLAGEPLADPWRRGGESSRSERFDAPAIICSLRREEGGPQRFSTSLAEAWVHGASVDWRSLFRGSSSRRVTLPTYAFQRQPYWHKPALANADVSSAGLSVAGHPLLGAALAPADGDGLILTGRLSLETHPWLSDHVVMGAILLPGTVLVELALHAGAECGCATISELTLQAPLVLSQEDAVRLQVVVGEPDDLGGRNVTIYSCAESDALASSTGGAWTLHGAGALAPHEQSSRARADGERAYGRHGGSAAPADGMRADGELAHEQVGASWPPGDAERLDTVDAYARLADLGMDYGPAFQGLQAVWRRGEEIFAEVALPADERGEAAKFGVHPALLDMALHGYAASLLDAPGIDEPGGVRLPFALSGVSLDLAGLSSLRVRISPAAPGTVSLVATDQAGTPALAIRSIALRSLSEAQLVSARGGARDCLFRLDWTVTPAPPQRSTERWVAVGAGAHEIAQALSAEGAPPAEIHADLGALATAIDEGAIAPRVVLVEVPARTDALTRSERATEASDSLDGGSLGAGTFDGGSPSAGAFDGGLLDSGLLDGGLLDSGS